MQQGSNRSRLRFVAKGAKGRKRLVARHNIGPRGSNVIEKAIETGNRRQGKEACRKGLDNWHFPED